MALQDDLNHLTTLIRNETSPRVMEVLDTFVGDLRRQQASQRSLLVGETAPNFTLLDQHQRSVTLYELLNEGPIVLKFYRGGWCPYCNQELRALHHARPTIEYGGARLIAITPESPKNIARTVRKNALDYQVLYDTNSEVARSFGIAVNLSEYMRAFYRSLGLNLSLRHADVIVRLPLPATYLIHTNYTVQYAFVDEDYTQRVKIAEVATALQQVQSERVHSYG